jgi:hypothetical protein
MLKYYTYECRSWMHTSASLELEKKLLTTEGTTIYLETTLGTSILHCDGKHWEENKPSTRDDQIVEG